MKHNFSGDYLTGLIPFGIWQPVKLVATNRLRLENYRVEYDLHKNAATAVFYIELLIYLILYWKLNLMFL